MSGPNGAASRPQTPTQTPSPADIPSPVFPSPEQPLFTPRQPLQPPQPFSPLPPLSLYVHIPWCVRKCPYCDFNSHGQRQPLPEADYVAALTADLDAALPDIAGREIVSIFFGGGTPSLFSGHAIDAMLTAIRARMPLAQDAEITLEANPGTAEAEKFTAFRAAGINRLSLGIQSFNPAHLQALGRIHDDGEARRAIEIAQRHFNAINLDLMYGLPQQTLKQALADLGQAMRYAPAHLSCYQLAIEPNTAFAARPPALDADLAADMQEAIEKRLAAAGYLHYETSAFALPGRSCRHNLNYWTFGDYLGIGAGAHSKLTRVPDIYANPRADTDANTDANTGANTCNDSRPDAPSRQFLPSGAPAGNASLSAGAQKNPLRVFRQVRWAQPGRYMAQAAAGHACQETWNVDDSELPGEFMMNALRLNQGFDAALFSQRTGLPLTCIEAPLQQAVAEGLIEWRAAPTPSDLNAPAAQTRPAGPSDSAIPARPGHAGVSRFIAPTPLGRRFLNRLLALFLP